MVILVQCIENLSMSSDRDRRVVFGTLIVDFGTRLWTNMERFYSTMVLDLCFGISVTIIGATENRIISFDRARRIIPAALVTIFGTHSLMNMSNIHLSMVLILLL